LCSLEPDETATAIVAVWDAQKHRLVWSSAGHPPPLRCRVGSFGFLLPRYVGVMLGADPASGYREQSKVMRPGTSLLFYTDGLIERRRWALDEQMERLKAAAEQVDDLAPQALCQALLAWRRGIGPLEDDVCLLVARLA